MTSVSQLRKLFERQRSLRKFNSESHLNFPRRDNELEPPREDSTLNDNNKKPPIPAPRALKLSDEEPTNYQNLADYSFYKATQADDVEDLRSQCISVMDESIREMKSERFIDKDSLKNCESDSSSDTSYLKPIEGKIY